MDARNQPDGIIELNSPFATELGFVKGKFFGYLWKDGDRITISFIESLHPGKGNLRALFDKIESLGFAIAVPTPSVRMRAICERRGMVPVMEFDPQFEDNVELMVSPRLAQQALPMTGEVSA